MMSVQTTMKDYFNSNKLKSSPLQSINMNNGIKRRSLSLKKQSTPTKPPKIEGTISSILKEPVKVEDDVISLLSDSEQEEIPSKKRLVSPDNQQQGTPVKQQNVGLTDGSIESLTTPLAPVVSESLNSSGDVSNSSATTIVYDMSPSAVFGQLPTTPSESLNTPVSSKGFYSPSKNVGLTVRSTLEKPFKVEDHAISLSSDSEQKDTPSKKRLVSPDNQQQGTPVKQQNVGLTVRSIESLMAPVAPVVSSVTAVLGQSPTTPSKSLNTPGSSKGYYSPSKKRVINYKTPAKRNLVNKFNQNISPKKNLNDSVFPEIVDENDDKTAFLVSIIEKCLKTDSLRHLLKEKSQVLLMNCMQVPKPGMTIMCRLYWCLHIWYRMEKIGGFAKGREESSRKSSSSLDLNNIVTCLANYGLITPSKAEGETKLGFDDYVKLLKRSELLQICTELKLKVQSKNDCVEKLRSYCKQNPIHSFITKSKVNNRTRVLEMLKKKTGDCFKISELAQETFYNLYVLMYLGIDYSIIREKKLEVMLIYDKIKREIYPIDKDMEVDDASVVFQDREEFYRYLEAHKIFENYLKVEDTKEKCEIVRQVYHSYKQIDVKHMLRYKSLPTWLRRFTPAYIYIGMLEKGVQELKRLKTEDDYKLAVDILSTLIDQIAFKQHKRALWYAEKALILHSYLDSYEEAAKVLLEGFKDDLTDDAKHELRPRAVKIANQQNTDLKEELRLELLSFATKDAILESDLPGAHIYKQPKDNYRQGGKLEFEVHTPQGDKATVSAEGYCLYHYVNSGQFTNGEHWEGRIVSTIFFLLFWDIIYSKPRGVAGVFLNHFQRYPLDLFCESFYMIRKTLIDERLAFIKQCTEEQLMDFMHKNWEKRPENNDISDVGRGKLSWEQITAVTSCAGAPAVAALCRRFALRYGHARSGFPDLTLWNANTKKIKFLEVKTDADKPSMKQLQWLHYLLQNGIDAGFCYVGVNTTRSKARSSAASLD